MIPTIYIVSTPNADWGVLYFKCNISNRKLYEGHDWDSGGLRVIVELYTGEQGHKIEYGEMTDPDECDGCTPDTIDEVLSYVKTT